MIVLIEWGLTASCTSGFRARASWSSGRSASSRRTDSLPSPDASSRVSISPFEAGRIQRSFCIEYLVVGSISALWILILLARFDGLPNAVPNAYLVLLVPLLYVLGMFSDRLGRFLTERHKKRIETAIRKDHADVTTQVVGSRLAVHLPDLAEQLEARRTRDRISRGVLANVPFLTAAVAARVDSGGALWKVWAVILGGVLLFLIVIWMWWRYQTLSSDYEIQCFKRLCEGGHWTHENPDDA